MVRPRRKAESKMQEAMQPPHQPTNWLRVRESYQWVSVALALTFFECRVHIAPQDAGPMLDSGFDAGGTPDAASAVDGGFDGGVQDAATVADSGGLADAGSLFDAGTDSGVRGDVATIDDAGSDGGEVVDAGRDAGPGPQDAGTGLGIPVPASALGADFNGPWAAYPTFPISVGLLGKRPGTAWKYIIAAGCNPMTQTTSASDPSNPCYGWGGVDAWTKKAATLGISVIYDFNGTPAYAVGSSGSICQLLNQAAVTSFATAIARRYASTGVQAGCTAANPQCNGVIKYWEEWNEIDDWACSGNGWQDTWANDALQAGWIYGAIKSVDANAVVGAPNMAGSVYAPAGTPVNVSGTTWSGGDFTVWLDHYLAAGGDKYADAVGFHAYGDNDVSYNGNGYYQTTTYGCDSETDHLHCAAMPLIAMYTHLRTVMAKHGLSTKPILVSEGGWGNDLQYPDACDATIGYTGCLKVADQQNYVSRWMILTASTWADGLGEFAQWYGYDLDWGTLNGGTFNGYAQSSQTTAAWNQTYSWVIGATFSSMCAQASGGNLIACDLRLASGSPAQIVFNDNQGNATSYLAPSWATRYTPLLGSPTTISGALSIGDAPVLIE
jgi:hypothetical protein